MPFRVLVCDDDVAVRHSIIELLRVDGYDTCEAGAALEALQVARGVKLDFGFFDYTLPDFDGVTAVRRLRAESIRFPWVLMSGGETIAERCMAAAGAVAFLPKPLDVATIRRILQECLGLAQGRGRSTGRRVHDGEGESPSSGRSDSGQAR